MFKSILVVLVLAGVAACFLACQVTDEASDPVDLNLNLQPLDRLSYYYARTAPPEPVAGPVNLSLLHNRGLNRCFLLHKQAGEVFMSRDLFCRIVSEAAGQVFSEAGLDRGSSCTPVDMRVLFCLFDDLRELGVFNIYSRNPDYNSLLAYLLNQGYLDSGEHSELAFIFERLASQGGQRAALFTVADPGLQTPIGRIAAEVMTASHNYWQGRAAMGDGTGKDGARPHRTDDRFFDISMKAAGDVLGVLIASVTGAGTVAAGLASIGGSYMMEMMANCFDHPPGVLESCSDTNLYDADYWASWPGPYWQAI
jgi:hypothetical protein